ncbi:putative glycosyltransferase [Methanocella paludicola SANAE]|uniref:Glycosyltransferase n=1 Tax=Methanocella paludicola (strain DSM 17711 / JCM 13418 / NBRC 101707 / SANAE) TaxID=304371 RepID=D1YWL6_METPS|nr:glycosyltransferase family 2 protein [Methanocella paludicola]BAI60838.1 putative glycosyltransferase [Methanocella paludicola SANAE]
MADLAIINHPIDPYAIGDILTVAKRFAKHVYVLAGYEDETIIAISRFHGAEVIDTSTTSQLSAFYERILKNPDDTLVTLYGNGAHDPERIGELVEQIRSGYDVAFDLSSISHGQINETIYLLNGRLRPGTSGFLACKCGILRAITADENHPDILGHILKRVKRDGLNVKYLDLYDLRSLFRKYSIGVVVPAYNEELLIEETINGIPEYVERIYVIDDCSTDHTPNIVRRLGDPRVTFIRHEKNQGVGGAIVTGYKLALDDGMDLVAVMAGDNQMDPAQLPRLLLPIIEGKADYTKGNRLISRKYSEGMSRWRLFGNNLLSLLTKIASGYWRISDPQNGYTVISRQALQALDLDSVYTYYGYCNDLLIKLNTFGMRAIDVAIPARYGRERSSIRYSRFILKVAPMIFRGFLWRLKTKYVVLDSNPLVLLYAAGMLLLPLGLLFCAWILVEAVLRASISAGYLPLAAIITLTGLQFLFFAMMFDRQAERSAGSSGIDQGFR